MKINRLYLQNFRSHRESDLNLDRVNFFLGHNNAGKTSLLAALEWGLTGRCYWTDRAGRGSGDLIQTSATGATVLVDVAGADQAVRTLNPNGLTFGGETSALAAQAKLYERLQTGEDDLRAALNVGAFLTMSPAGQKTYLFSVLGLRWDLDTVLAALDRWAKQGGHGGHGGRAERLRELVRPLYPPQVQAGPEVLDLIEKKLRDARRDTKRDLQRVQALLAGSGAPDPAPGVTLAEAQAQLADLRDRRDRILTMLADRKQSEDRRQALQANYEAVCSRLAQTTAAQARLAGQAAASQAGPGEASMGGVSLDDANPDGTAPDSAAKAYQGMITTGGAIPDHAAPGRFVQDGMIQGDAFLSRAAPDRADNGRGVLDQAALDRAAALAAERQAALAGLASELGTLRAAFEALAQAGGYCPLAPDYITCAMTLPQREGLLADLAARTDAKAAAVEQARLTLEQARRENERLKAYAAKAQEAELAAGAARCEQARLAAQASELSRQARELTAELQGYDALEAPDLSPLAGLDAQIAQAEALADQIKAYQQALAQEQALDRESRALAAGLAEYELLVKAFGPDGIRRSALANSLDPFTARVNENLAALTDKAYTIEFAPDLSPVVRHAGATVPARLLSTSELLRVGIAIQEAIAAHLGLRLLAIDGADLLDQDNRDRLTGFVLERAAAGEFEQVLVFSTVGDVPPANPGLPGLKMFWVEAGTVQEI